MTVDGEGRDEAVMLIIAFVNHIRTDEPASIWYAAAIELLLFDMPVLAFVGHVAWQMVIGG